MIGERPPVVTRPADAARAEDVRAPPSGRGDVHRHVVADDDEVLAVAPDAGLLGDHRAQRARDDGLPTIVGRVLLAFAIAAAVIAPRLMIGPFAPA